MVYFNSQWKESHVIWTKPEGIKLYVGHEITRELSVFDISSSTNRINPKYIANKLLGNITMLNGQVWEWKSYWHKL